MTNPSKSFSERVQDVADRVEWRTKNEGFEGPAVALGRLGRWTVMGASEAMEYTLLGPRWAPLTEVMDAELEAKGAAQRTGPTMDAAIAMRSDEREKAQGLRAQVEEAVHELRNALVPARHHMVTYTGSRIESALDGVKRALDVATGLAKSLGGL